MSVPLPSGSLVITDLHLDVERPEDHAGFVEFLQAARSAPALVILGDLFEYWLGPSHVERARPLLAALRAFPGDLHLIPGNRDVLIGSEVAPFGITLHPDGFVGIEPDRALGGILFQHGDELCTSDLDYLRLRRVLRSGPMRGTLRRLPRFVARRIARWMRSKSSTAVAAKAPLEVEQDRAEAHARLSASGAAALVVGHAHRFVDEALPGGGRFCVLDAFGSGPGARDLVRLDWQAGQPVLEFSSVAQFCAEATPAPR